MTEQGISSGEPRRQLHELMILKGDRRWPTHSKVHVPHSSESRSVCVLADRGGESAQMVRATRFESSAVISSFLYWERVDISTILSRRGKSRRFFGRPERNCDSTIFMFVAYKPTAHSLCNFTFSRARNWGSRSKNSFQPIKYLIFEFFFTNFWKLVILDICIAFCLIWRSRMLSLFS